MSAGGRKVGGYSASISPGPHTARRRLAAEVEQMVGDLDQRVTQVMQTESNRVRMYADQLQRFVEGLQQMRMAREIERERRQQTIKLLENKVTRELNNARKERVEFGTQVEERSARLLDERSQELKAQSLETHQEEE